LKRNGNKRAFALAFIVWALGAFLLTIGRAEGIEASWWDSDWKVRRKLTVNPSRSGFTGGDVAYATFMVGDYAKPDGSDIRIVAGRKVVPFQVIFKGPGAYATVTWEKSTSSSTYHAYFGNPKAKALKQKWEPKRGLLLETRRFRSGNPSNLAAMRYIIRKNTEVMGKSFVDRVFFGFNPHGPSVNNVNIFTGYLIAPVSGKYEFYTSSDDASFLLVDDKLVVQWPGWHGPVNRARFKGTVSLRKGLHKFQYLHVQGGYRQIMAAYWKPPKSGSIQIIPQGAFATVSRASVDWMRVKSGRFLPDFWPANKGEAVLGDHDDVFLIKMHFDNRTPIGHRRSFRCRWDFGDGATASTIAPTHVYLATGIYKVTLTMTRGSLKYSTTSSVVVDRNWKTMQTARKIDQLTDYYEFVKKYPLDNMDPRSLHNAAWMFEKIGRKTKMVEAVTALLKTKDDVPDTLLIKNTDRLTEYLLSGKKAVEAISTLGIAEKRAYSDQTKAKFAVAKARVMLVYTHNPTGAKKELDKVLAKYKKAKSETLRRSYILSGDVVGKLVTTSADDAYKAALAEYEKAVKIKTNLKFRGRFDEVAIPSLSRSIEDYLRRNELETCEKLLDEWEFRKPTDKLVGYYTLLRAQWWLQTGENQIAGEMLQSLVEINPASTYGDQALWKLANCHAFKNNYDKADEALDRIAKLYPESSLIAKVAERKKELRRPKTTRKKSVRPSKKRRVKKKNR